MKRKSLAQLIRKEDFDVCFIQEIKDKVIYENIVVSMWGNKKVEWSFKGVNGRSGGFLIIWKKGSFDLCFSVVGEGFVGIKVRWKGNVLFYSTLIHLVLYY